MLPGALAQGATVADDPRVQQLERKVQLLEKALRDMETLVIELADEVALLNIKLSDLEKRLPAK
jgi:regulator of replication initiation timing